MRDAACSACRRRSWLLAELTGVLDYRARERSGLLELLAREEEELIETLGGRRKDALRTLQARPGADLAGADARAVCRHDSSFPSALRGPRSPRVLYLAGQPARLSAPGAATVALVGSRRPSDYGIEMARSLARALAWSEVRILTVLMDGIARVAATAASKEPRGGVVVSGDGLPAAGTGAAGRLAALAGHGGCSVSELPSGRDGRRWGRIAAERTAVELSDLVIVVEAAETSAELFVAELARAAGRPLAAVPGRSTSPLARGPLALLRDGAALVRDGEDALELLGRAATPRARSERARRDAPLPPRLKLVLEQLAAGRDTPEQLVLSGGPAAVLLALTELELLGRVRLGRGGRYVACAAGR